MKKIKFTDIRKYPLLLVLLGIVMHGVSVFMQRGHNLILALGFIFIVGGAIMWVMQQKSVKSV